MWTLWIFAFLGAAIYCVVKAVIDLRAKRYVWGVIGLLCAGIILLAPIQTHAVKVDMPSPTN